MAKKIVWQDLPERLTAFSKRNTVLVNLQTDKVVQYYAANTRITFVQRAAYKGHYYYRTETAALNGFDVGFNAYTFGLPDLPSAPSAPSRTSTKTSAVKQNKQTSIPLMAQDGAAKKGLGTKFKKMFNYLKKGFRNGKKSKETK